jgi:hypothetical protein
MGGLLVTAVVAIPASAAGGFGEPVVVGAGPVVVGAGWASPVAALDAHGNHALAWTDGKRVHVARRTAGGTWTTQTISPPADQMPDLQLVVTRGGDTIAAWTETYADGNVKGGVPDRFLAAIARPGQPFGGPHVIAKGPRADSALPRMAALADGRVVLVWRAARWPSGGELRLAFRRPGEPFGRSRRLRHDGIAPAVVATSDGGAVLTWALPGRYRAPRVLRAARLPAHGHRVGRSFQLSASALEGARLAAGADNVVVASWASRHRPVGILAAQLTPRRGPVRILSPQRPQATGATVALGPEGAVLAAFPALTSDAPGCACAGVGQWAASATAAGGFAAPVPLTPASPAVGLARPTILPTGEALVVWSQTALRVGAPSSDVLVASRPAGSSSFAVETLGSGRGSSAAVSLAQAAGHVLVAWPALGPNGGLDVTERQ